MKELQTNFIQWNPFAVLTQFLVTYYATVKLRFPRWCVSGLVGPSVGRLICHKVIVSVYFGCVL